MEPKKTPNPGPLPFHFLGTLVCHNSTIPKDPAICLSPRDSDDFIQASEKNIVSCGLTAHMEPFVKTDIVYIVSRGGALPAPYLRRLAVC